MKKILLVGGAGFIGSHLTRKLLALGHDVKIIDPLYVYSKIDDSWLRVVQNYRLNKLMAGAYLHHGTFEKIGWEVMEVWNPDIVVHLGAIPLEGTGDENIERGQIVNDTSLTYQVAALARKKNVERLVYMSSLFAYGNFPSPEVEELSTLSPVTAYGIDKAMGEHIVKSIAPHWSIIRTTSIYGFGDANLRSTSVFVDKALRGESFWINEQAMLDFIYIDDLIDGIVKVMFHPAAENNDYHISGGKARPLRDFVDELSNYFPDLQCEYKSLNDRPGRGTLLNNKARKQLGWEPQHSLSEGIKKYVDLAREYNCG